MVKRLWCVNIIKWNSWQLSTIISLFIWLHLTLSTTSEPHDLEYNTLLHSIHVLFSSPSVTQETTRRAVTKRWLQSANTRYIGNAKTTRQILLYIEVNMSFRKLTGISTFSIRWVRSLQSKTPSTLSTSAFFLSQMIIKIIFFFFIILVDKLY